MIATTPANTFTETSRRAYTLLELVVAMGVTGILLVAIGSSILLASYAIPQPDDPHTRSTQMSRALEQLATDLQHAHRIITRQPHELAFTVQDRTGDGSVHAIRYAWSGVPGEPLTRQYDANDPTAVLESVESIDFTYHMKQSEQTYRGLQELLPQERLSNYNSTLNLSRFRVGPEDWTGQTFRRSFDVNTVGWHLTGGRFRARRSSGTSETVHARLRAGLLDGTPAAAILIDKPLDASEFSLLWSNHSIAYPQHETLPSGLPLHLTFEQPDGNDRSIHLRYDNLQLLRPRGGMVETDSAGTEWQSHNRQVLLHRIYGRPIVERDPHVANQQRLAWVEFEIAPYPDKPAIRTAIAPAFALPSLEHHWNLDFRRDPTSIDRSGDGHTDWHVAGAGTFATNTLSAGIWEAEQQLRTNPMHNFTGQTRLIFSARHARTNADGGAIAQLNVHHSDGYIAPLLVRVARKSGNRSSVSLYNASEPTSEGRLAHIDELPNDFIEVQLLVSASQSSVNVQVGGIDHGTFPYERVPDDEHEPGVTIGGMTSSGHAVFDYVYLESATEP